MKRHEGQHRASNLYSIGTHWENDSDGRAGEYATRFGWAFYTIAALALAFFFCSQGG